LDAGGLGGDEVRYLLKRGDEDGKLDDNAISKVDTTQTFYRGVLKDFISSSIVKDGLAQHYLLVLSGHGNGLISDFLSRDVDTPDKLSIPKIQWVLREVKKEVIKNFPNNVDEEKFKIDILGLDSCMMSMAEIGYELSHYVNFMVGAEGFEPNSGWPYERILSDILTNPNIQPDDLVVKIVDRYVNYYKDFLPAARSVDLSACDLSRCGDLASALKELADVLYDKISESETMRQIILAHWEAQTYKDDQYADLYDFCDLLDQGPSENPNAPVTGSVVMKGLSVDDRIRTGCKKVKTILTGNGKNGGDPKKPLVIRSRHSGPAVQYSRGLSVYFPWSNVIDSYEDLEFANDTHWRRFLLKYVEVTRRIRRPCPSDLKQVQVVDSELFFNPVSAGFDFILSENKNAPTVNKVLGNKVGSMKNPPLDHVVCCPEKKETPAQTTKGAEPPESEETEWPEGIATTETGKTNGKPSAAPSGDPSVVSNGDPNVVSSGVGTSPRPPGRKK